MGMWQLQVRLVVAGETVSSLQCKDFWLNTKLKASYKHAYVLFKLTVTIIELAKLKKKHVQLIVSVTQTEKN